MSKDRQSSKKKDRGGGWGVEKDVKDPSGE